MVSANATKAQPKDARGEHERRHAERLSEAARAGMWDNQLDWLLSASGAALGERGSTGSVISAIEHGGARAAVDPDAGMLARIGWSRDDERRRGPQNVERARRLGKRWHQIARPQREALLAHYLLTAHTRTWPTPNPLLDAFGMLAGVVAWQWLAHASAKRRRSLAPQLAAIAAEKSTAGAELRALEDAIRAARASEKAARRSAGHEGQAILMGSRAAALDELARPIRSRLLDLQAADGVLVGAIAGSGGRDALDGILTANALALRTKATATVKGAHTAWYATAGNEATRWAEGGGR